MDEPFEDGSGKEGALRNDPLDARLGPLERDEDDRSTSPEPRAPEPAPTLGESSALYALMRARAQDSAGSDIEIEPPPQVTLRLDGTLALVQRQFLHADLDLRWRSVVQRPAAPDAPTDARIGATADDDRDPPQFEVHRLQQSRVIRTDRWEYFDSQRFGVLLRITELDPLEPLPPPEPERAEDPSSLSADEPTAEPANESDLDAGRRR